MTSKDTIRTHRHISEVNEVNRIIDNYQNQFNIKINKLEASAILAMRSQDIFWTDKKAREAIMKIRGIL